MLEMSGDFCLRSVRCRRPEGGWVALLMFQVLPEGRGAFFSSVLYKTVSGHRCPNGLPSIAPRYSWSAFENESTYLVLMVCLSFELYSMDDEGPRTCLHASLFFLGVSNTAI